MSRKNYLNSSFTDVVVVCGGGGGSSSFLWNVPVHDYPGILRPKETLTYVIDS